MNPVTSKRQFYDLWNQGLFGNKPRTWHTLAEFQKSGFKGAVALRYCGSGSGAPFIPDLNSDSLVRELAKLKSGGWNISDFHIAEQLSPSITHYLINGEVARTDRGLALYHSLENKLMRDALRSSGQQVFGLQALMILQRVLLPSDYEELMELLDRFPDHVVEFSGFDRFVGVIPRRKMIVWEVRLY